MQVVLFLHSIIRWAILLFGAWSIIGAIAGVTIKRAYTANDNRNSLLFMIFCDTQFLIGFILYFVNGWYKGMSNLGDAVTRFFAMEHMSMMLVAWVLIHIGRASAKKASTDLAKHKRTLLFFGIAILIILISIPWQGREAIGRPLFRGFN